MNEKTIPAYVKWNGILYRVELRPRYLATYSLYPVGMGMEPEHCRTAGNIRYAVEFGVMEEIKS